MTKFLENVKSTKCSLRELFPETPIQKNEYLSDKFNAEVFLKREDLSPVRSYKIRGAYNSIKKVIDAGKKNSTFVCASAGNHAQGVAFVSKHFGVKSFVFMPVTTPQQKINKTQAFGGNNIEIVLTGDYFDNTLESAIRFSEKQNAVFLPPFDSKNVLEGQATVMSELTDQMQDQGLPDIIFLAVGGGGLSTGMLQYCEELGIDIDFRLVEPLGAASLTTSLRAGSRVTLSKLNNFVDGAAVATIGAINYDFLRTFNLDKVYAVPEDRVCMTMMEMLNLEGIVLEPAGALSIDALRELPKEDIIGKKVVCVVSGGNFDFERLPDVKERALRFSGKKKYLILRMPQRPGALKEFLGVLGPDDDITRFEYLKKSARNFGSVLLGIETSENRNFEILFDNITLAGFEFEDITDNPNLKEFIV
ncbi:MAG: threonine ammonia-lyase IlvA [Pseudomonadota bacterium]|nr:threonine ammonia-lyase IlvA [Pseudomonadota bacterium]